MSALIVLTEDEERIMAIAGSNSKAKRAIIERLRASGLKRCAVCRSVLPVMEFGEEARATDGLKSECRACARESGRKHYAANPEAGRDIVRAGRLTPSGRAKRLWRDARKRGKERGLPFNLSVDDIVVRIERGVCEATGLPLMLEQPGELGCRHPLAPSLDQTDAAQGYTPENTRVVCHFWNTAKSQYPEWMVADLMATIVANMPTAPAGLKAKVRPLTYNETQP